MSAVSIGLAIMIASMAIGLCGWAGLAMGWHNKSIFEKPWIFITVLPTAFGYFIAICGMAWVTFTNH